MTSPSTSLFGIHAQALGVWRRRMEVLASNLANADTPGYLARDIDFKQALADSRTPAVTLATTEPGHIASPNAAPAAAHLMYRVPMQPSRDGNTVDTQVEQAAFAQNTVHYQASLTFISDRIRRLRLAIGGH